MVVGSGPNGLAAAVTLAQAGLSVLVLEAAADIGGGTRTRELTLPGLIHDVCSAVHPLGAASPFLRSLPLGDHGLVWRWPSVDVAHPLDGGGAATAVRSIGDTAAGLGADERAWIQVFGPLVERFEPIAADVLGPLVRRPRHPVDLACFGLRAGLPATVLSRRFRTLEARALFVGCAAHLLAPLHQPATSGPGVVLLAAGHRYGWPVAEGGSQAITTAMASLLGRLGGRIETGACVRSSGDIPPARIVCFDTAPGAVADILGDHLPPRVAHAYRCFRHGPGVYKLDLAVDGGVPWTASVCRRAGTVHVGGRAEEIIAAEASVARGRLPARPFVLVAQQHVCDPTRSVGAVHPVWAYGHVPAGFDGDATDLVLDQIERFAPRLRERILACHVAGPAQLEAGNANDVGGDIAGGANDPLQLLMRPRPTWHPYDTGVAGMYLCSSSTPPGAGVHGMSGHHAALRALDMLGVSP